MRLPSISPVSFSLVAVALVYLSAASLYAEALPATVADQEWFKGYHTYEENQNWLHTQVQSHPMISSLLTLGKSHQGRNITGIKIGNGPNNVVIIGLQRTRDWITVPVVQYIIKQLVTRNDAHLEKYTFHIIPATNPDGYVYTWTTNRNWGKTRSQNGLCYGVDLSRNWDYKWGGAGASTAPCSDTYAGPSASSEAETTLVAGHLKSLQNVALLIDFYAFGQLWTYPYHYSTLLPDNNVYLESLARKAIEAIKQPYGTQYKAGSAANIRSIVSGTLMDYVYGTNITRAAFTVYLRDHGQYGFVLPRELVLPTVEETWAGVAAVLEIDLDMK